MNEATVAAGEPVPERADAATGLVNVYIPLSGELPDGWYAIFVEGPAGVTEYSDMPEIGIIGESVHFACAPDALGRLAKHVRARVEASNRVYNTQVLPRLRAERERAEEARAADEREEQRLLDEAKRVIDEL